MHGHPHIWSTGSEMVGWFGFTLLFVFACLVLWLVLDRTRSRTDTDRAQSRATARRTLAERFARDELDVEEYNHRCDTLR